MASNRRVLLKSRPQGEPTHANLDVVDSAIPKPKDGEYLSRTIWMSLDPYMRGRTRAKSLSCGMTAACTAPPALSK